MPLTTGLQLIFGVQPVNPVPVDSWSGPYTGSVDTIDSAKAAANAAIDSSIRFQSMEVRLIVGGVSYKYWYRDGIADSDLVLFSAGTGLVTGSLYPITSSAAVSASHALIADTANTFRGRDINSFATTGSNTFVGNQSVTGSITFTGTLSGSFISASKLFVETGSIYKFYSQKARTDILSGSGYNFSFGYTDLSRAYNFTAVTASFHTLRLTTGSVPAFGDKGAAGEIRIDGDFVYLYAGEVWRRIAANRWFV